ncbi:hypothetical protein CEXT_142921 [Caerostris extrusa]|uniref:LAGLIDADG homing endonuclease n=1 Tax=Caerostris extrusa TaxID=172846 RepID=A0AAV4RSK4_CAEEX|nr:hypothetical protein CEXT_142921 [Caerostris extrusa]
MSGSPSAKCQSGKINYEDFLAAIFFGENLFGTSFPEGRKFFDNVKSIAIFNAQKRQKFSFLFYNKQFFSTRYTQESRILKKGYANNYERRTQRKLFNTVSFIWENPGD